jgi:SAM-dependent methyltransferase
MSESEKSALLGGEEHVWGTAPTFVGPRHELRERLLLDLFLSASPGPHVLNVGAGQGSFTRLLERGGFDVVSSDVTAPALDVLRASVRGEVLLADMTDLPFGDDTFDAVVAGEVLEHIEDDGKAISESARVLRPGGVLVVSVPAHPTWFGLSDEWAGHVRRYTRQGLEETIVGSGLDLEVLKPWGFPVSALYHRAVYDKRAARLANSNRDGLELATRVLRVALLVDRLFVGVEWGCLGFLARARKAA